MVIQFCAGVIYMWSVFAEPVADHLDWDPGAASLTSSVMLAMFVLGIIAGGRVQDKIGPKRAALIGSAMIGAGMAATAFVGGGTPWLVYFTYGITGGLGVGTVYSSTIAAAQKWFPDRRGFASGMILGAFGFSLVVFSPLAKSMLAGLGVPHTFLIFGAAFLVVCGVCSLFVQNPPEGYLPKGYAPARAASSGRQYSPGQILKTKQFYLLVGGLFFTLPAYFILNPILLSLGRERGLSEGLAVLGVALTGIGSALGRLAVPWASDRIGRKPAVISVAAMVFVASLLMTTAQNALFLVCIVCISFGFGGTVSAYSVMTAESFGTKYGGMNFGLVMAGFGLSALVFPLVSNILSSGGGYIGSFVLSAAACVAAVALVLSMNAS